MDTALDNASVSSGALVEHGQWMEEYADIVGNASDIQLLWCGYGVSGNEHSAATGEFYLEEAKRAFLEMLGAVAQYQAEKYSSMVGT